MAIKENISSLNSNIIQFPATGAPLRTYEMSFDQMEATDINSIALPVERQRRQEQFLSYVTTQMETHLGERFNVSLSRFEYDIKDGQLWGKDMDVPFIESLKKGRDYRKIHGKEIDRIREEAEVTGFEKMEGLLCDPETPIGTMMLSVSRPGKGVEDVEEEEEDSKIEIVQKKNGFSLIKNLNEPAEKSSYEHNFYDVFTVKEDAVGKRYIESRRYASALSLEDYKDKLGVFTQLELDEDDPAASLLANPIAIQNTLIPDDIHHYLHKEYGYMDKETFDVIVKHCRGNIVDYVKSLLSNPFDQNGLALRFNSILNKSEEIHGAILRDGIETWQKINPMFSSLQIEEDIEKYGNQLVKEIVTGCGMSGGYDIAKSRMASPFSVGQFAPDKYGDREVECPACKHVNLRPYGELIPICGLCKSDKIAC